jgi:hypothetical protein
MSKVLFTVTLETPIETIGSPLRSNAFVIESSGQIKKAITNGLMHLYKSSRQADESAEDEIQTEPEPRLMAVFPRSKGPRTGSIFHISVRALVGQKVAGALDGQRDEHGRIRIQLSSTSEQYYCAVHWEDRLIPTTRRVQGLFRVNGQDLQRQLNASWGLEVEIKEVRDGLIIMDGVFDITFPPGCHPPEALVIEKGEGQGSVTYPLRAINKVLPAKAPSPSQEATDQAAREKAREVEKKTYADVLKQSQRVTGAPQENEIPLEIRHSDPDPGLNAKRMQATPKSPLRSPQKRQGSKGRQSGLRPREEQPGGKDREPAAQHVATGRPVTRSQTRDVNPPEHATCTQEAPQDPTDQSPTNLVEEVTHRCSYCGEANHGQANCPEKANSGAVDKLKEDTVANTATNAEGTSSEAEHAPPANPALDDGTQC